MKNKIGKKFFITSGINTVIFIVLLICVPFIITKRTTMFLIEIGLAVLWTIINLIILMYYWRRHE